MACGDQRAGDAYGFNAGRVLGVKSCYGPDGLFTATRLPQGTGVFAARHGPPVSERLQPDQTLSMLGEGMVSARDRWHLLVASGRVALPRPC